MVLPPPVSMSSVNDNQICSKVRPLELLTSVTNVNNAVLVPCSSSPIISAQCSTTSASLHVGTTPARASSATAAHMMLNSLITGSVHNPNQHQILTDDPRALQLALELSMVSLNEVAAVTTGTGPSTTGIMTSANINSNKITSCSGTINSNASVHFTNYQQQLQQEQQQNFVQNQQSTISNALLQQQQQQQFDLNTLSAAVSAASVNVNGRHCHRNISAMNSANNIGGNNNSNNGVLNSFPAAAVSLLPSMEDRSKKSQNMTECVPVPSSEHVAEIVGRQGCKIKALRAKTNTYIKTPVRGEEPVFVVTGRKEDVTKAKREILSAAEHFSLIRATRKPSLDGGLIGNNNNGNLGNNGVSAGCGKTPPGPPSIPGQVTIQVRVPYRVVGLVVGPKGATIKHIQHQTQTYIVTPSREKEPIFEVTGLPDNVQSARKQIEAHIALRTGNLPLAGVSSTGVCNGNSNTSAMLSNISNDTFSTVQSLKTLSQILNDSSADPNLLVSFYRSGGIRSAFDYLENDNGVATAVAVAAMAGKASPISGSVINFNMNGGNSDSSIENNGSNCGSNMGNIKLTNQLSVNSLGNCNNFHLENIDNAHQDNTYFSRLTNTFNLNGGSGCGATDFVADFEVDYHQQNIQSSALPPMNSCQQSSSSVATHSHFVNDVNTSTTRINTAMSAVNLTTVINNATATTSMMNTGNRGLPTMVNVNNACNHNSIGSNNTAGGGIARSSSSASSTTSSKSTNNSGSGSSSHNSNSSRPELMNIWKNVGDSLDVDEGIGDSPNIWTLPAPLTALTGSHCSPSTSVSPTDSLLGEISVSNHINNYLSHLINGSAQHEPNIKKKVQSQHQSNSEPLPSIINPTGIRRDCLICSNKEVTAVLVPCGHNMFCMDCANRICTSEDSICPVCSLTVYHAMRILA